MVNRNPLYVNPVMLLLENILKDLVERSRTNWVKDLQDLITENAQYGGHPYAFLFGGRVFHIVATRKPANVPVKAIHDKLLHKAHVLLDREKKLEANERRLKQGLHVIVSKCNNRQDLRDALPDILVDKISDLRLLERQRPEGFVLENNPLLAKQYENTVNLALSFQAECLLN